MTEPMPADNEFRTELKSLLNYHSRENGSDTPDWVLADYLLASLAAYDAAVKARDSFWQFAPRAVTAALAVAPVAAVSAPHEENQK
jgi:hypothetical protein